MSDSSLAGTGQQASGRGPQLSPLLAFVCAVGPVVATSVLGQIATYPSIPTWYAGLVKPGFNPPNWIFGPVWTALYVLMAFAAWRILRLPAATPGRTPALLAFYIQLALNAAWSWMFFNAHNITAALVNIVIQLGVILWTTRLFQRLDKVAAWCLVPLAGWVAFATVLTFEIWRLN